MIDHALFCVSLLYLIAGVYAAPSPTTAKSDRHAHDHSHAVQQALPGDAWHHEPNHPVHKLFRRDGGSPVLAAVGSPSWAAAYPTWTPDSNSLPASWVSALNGAVAAGLIPNIPQSTGMPNQSPTYPAGFDPTSPNVCSFTYQCVAPGDVASAPDGVFASSFDDGPTQFSPTLLEFLESQGKTTTHFMIGVNILQNPTQFESIFNAGHDIAVHTYTHPYMTTLSNLDLVAQFGWTMQIIYDSTGGRVPKYWRPPYGDTDMRVRAIAKEIFGLTTVVWNHDSADWAQTATPPIETALTGFLASPKHPGLIILEHELTNITVSGFIEAYPLIQQNGWNFQSLIKASGNGATYQNAQSDTGAVTPMSILASGNFVPVSSTTSSSSSSGSSSTSSSSSTSMSGSTSTSSSTSASATTTSTSPSTTPTTQTSGAQSLSVQNQRIFGAQSLSIGIFFITLAVSLSS